MPASWVKRAFDGVGVTQYPPGPHLAAVQAHYAGAALLCIDVSGSMSGRPLAAARQGATQFLAEAREADYQVGLVLWNAGIAASVPLGAPATRTDAVLRTATASGGTNLVETLRHAISVLAPLTGDRVVCIFGDGDVGDPRTCTALVREARVHGIRFVVRGLGEAATEALSVVLTPDDDVAGQVVADASRIADGIASMARHLRP